MSLGGPEVLVIIVIAVLVLGPDKLPNALRTFGRTMGEIRKFQEMAKTEIDKAMNMPDSTELQSDTSQPPLLKTKKADQQTSLDISNTSGDSVAPIIDDEDEEL